MVRTQIQLTAEQSRQLKDAAARRGASVSELIRQGVDIFLDQEGGPTREELAARAVAAVGRFHSSVPDVSRHHDEYLGEAFRR